MQCLYTRLGQRVRWGEGSDEKPGFSEELGVWGVRRDRTCRTTAIWAESGILSSETGFFSPGSVSDLSE